MSFTQQPFEAYPEMKRFIQQMAFSGVVPSGSNWTAFLYELNRICGRQSQVGPVWRKEYEKQPPADGSYHCRVRIPNEPPYPTLVKGVIEFEDGEWRTGSVDEKVVEWLEEN